ncbi:coenzyme F420-0:L-glutamate ligase [Infirmifilum lucidum]|uniref:Coenzyme F420-0:L-glutamate ligase n=1 Tax=Infirmifilum lucidum TaxID=2776706 RepID=A0A7L9FGN4_9CREN|nr:coenzyme F420-0:L-glutamate ligase [Infirmifilum lucidum]QOJ78791.1 coenzyme F420-0:L-glutamate ligase [Infirmifilum lucidum]
MYARKEGKRGAGIIVLTSEMVSKAEGRVYRLEGVKPSLAARFLSRVYGKDPRAVKLILRASEGISFVIPVRGLAERYGYLFREYARDEGAALELLRKDPYIFMTRVRGMVLSDAGLDFSNSTEGYCTLPPEDPDLSARRIRARVRELTGKDVAVVIADTEWKLDKFGTVDVAIGSSGIQPVSRNFGARDLYGKPKFGGLDDLTDLVAAAANLLFGQTDEAVPVVIIRGLRYERSERGVRDVLYPEGAMRGAIFMILLEYVRLKAVLLLLRLLLLFRRASKGLGSPADPAPGAQLARSC